MRMKLDFQIPPEAPMNMFSDEKIENRLITAIDPVVEGSKAGCSSFELTFEDSGEEYGLNAFWDSKESCWNGRNEMDPLSLLLVSERPERKSVNKLDDETVATIAHVLNRPAGWVRSFQHGWYGRSNGDSSIMGYLLGRKLRIKYKG